MRRVIDETLLDAEVEQALAPFKRVVPPHVLERMRVALRVAALTHPDVAPLTRAALQRKDVEASHEAGPDVDAATAEATEEAMRKTTKKPAAGDGG